MAMLRAAWSCCDVGCLTMREAADGAGTAARVSTRGGAARRERPACGRRVHEHLGGTRMFDGVRGGMR